MLSYYGFEHTPSISTQTLSLLFTIQGKRLSEPEKYPELHRAFTNCSIFHQESLAGLWHYSKSLPTRTLPISALIPSVNNFDCVGKIPLIIHVLRRMVHKGAVSSRQQLSICLVIKNSRPSNGAEMQIYCLVGATGMSWKDSLTLRPLMSGYLTDLSCSS